MEKKIFYRRIISGLVLLLTASVLLAACGNEATSTPQPKDLPKDRLLFLSNRDGWPDLYTIDQGGKVVQRLTESAAAEYGAVWSPDGKQVAFTELEGDQANGDYARVRRVVIIDADGKNRKVIANDAFNPAWSPDGTKILFVRATPNGNATGEANPSSERYRANIRALPANQVAPSPTGSTSPGVTSRPAGSPAATTTPRPGTPGSTPSTSVRPASPTANATSAVPTNAPTFGDPSGAVKNVTLPPGFVPPQLPGVTAQPTMVPPSPVTGSTAGNSRYKGGLYIAPVDGSAAVKNGTPVLLVADNAVEGRWSPDGTKIAYLAGSNDLSQPRSLYLMNPDGGNKTSLSQQAKLDGLDILQAAWSPDGQALAFAAVDFSRDRIALYRLAVANNTVRRLTDYNGSARDLTGLIWAYDDYFNPASRLHFGPVWSPNSRRIAFADGSNTISVVEAENGNRTSYPVGAAALGQDKDSVLNVTWLPDNRRIIYDRAEAGRTALLTEANYYIFDYFGETLETLDTVNKNTTAIAGPGTSFFTPQCCGIDLLGNGATDATTPTANAKPTAPINAINGSKPEGKLVYTSGVGQRQLIVNDLKTHDRTILSSGLFKLLDFSLSPRNDRLVYLEVGEKYNATLYLSTLDGKQKRKLSEGTGEPDDLSSVVLWSPDGRQVAFQVLKGDPNLKPGLYVLTVEAADTASAPRLLTDMQVSGFGWSPDSRQIAFKVDTGYYELWTVSVEGGPATAKQLSQLGIVNPNYASLGKGVAWSPSGQWIAATGPTNFSRFALWLVNTSTGKVAEIQSNVIARVVGWTPDSSRVLAVIASFSQNTDVQAYNLNLDKWRPYGNGSGPQISSDGFFFAYYSRQDLRFNNGAYSPTSPTDQPGRLVISQVSNGDLRPIPLDFSPYFGFKARFFAWSPDGRILAYYYNNSIFGVGPDGQNPQVLGRAFTIDKLGWAKG